MKVRTKRPPMSARQATMFDRFSVGNAVMAESALDCGCKAYVDIYTYNRWKAQEMQVIKGQKSVHLPLVRITEREDKETGEIRQRRMLTSSAVFCRHQVEPMTDKAKASNHFAPVDDEPTPNARERPTALVAPILEPVAPASKVDQVMAGFGEV
jgi:hypothetical protein